MEGRGVNIRKEKIVARVVLRCSAVKVVYQI